MNVAGIVFLSLAAIVLVLALIFADGNPFRAG
jgi:hypothetical protein